MKMIKTLAVVCAFAAAPAYAVDPQLSDMTCDQLRDKYAATPEAQARFADLKGSCQGVYNINGNLYAMTAAVIRHAGGSSVTLYIPATDHTFSVTPDSSARVVIGGRKVRVRDLNRGDEVHIYLSVDKLATERVDAIAFATEDDHAEEAVHAPLVAVAALPTTG